MQNTPNETATVAARIADMVKRRESLTARSVAFGHGRDAGRQTSARQAGAATACAVPASQAQDAAPSRREDSSRTADAELSARALWDDAADLGIERDDSPAVVAGTAAGESNRAPAADSSADAVVASAPELAQHAAESAPVISDGGGDDPLPSAPSPSVPCRAVTRHPMARAGSAVGMPDWLTAHLRACGVRAGP